MSNYTVMLDGKWDIADQPPLRYVEVIPAGQWSFDERHHRKDIVLSFTLNGHPATLTMPDSEAERLRGLMATGQPLKITLAY